MVVNSRIKHLGLSAVRGEEAYVARIAELPLSLEEFRAISGMADYIGVTPESVSYTHLTLPTTPYV